MLRLHRQPPVWALLAALLGTAGCHAVTSPGRDQKTRPQARSEARTPPHAIPAADAWTLPPAREVGLAAENNAGSGSRD